MPIGSFTDYITVMDEFITHWQNTDSALILPDGTAAVSLVDFTTLRGDLDSCKTTLQSSLNSWENARVILDQTRRQAGDRIAEFNRRIRAEFPNNALFNRLPVVPNRTAGRDAFLTAMDDALDLWERVNGQPATPVFTAPLLLLGGMTRAQFLTLRGALDAAFTARGSTGQAVLAQRLERNAYQDRAKALMVQYRLKIEALYAADSVAVLSLPRLTPLPGHTPDPVALTATWNPDTAAADLTWTASTDAELDHYEVRSVPGPDYETDDESVIANIPPGAPLSYTSSAGFGLPGAAVSYKIYVRLTTGHQAGSEPVTVMRPEE